MNLQQLKYYVELSKYKSISEAANSLYITQQGLSLSMSRLEAELSCKLFVRTSFGLQFTEQGKFFLEHAKAMLEHYEVCRAAFENDARSNGSLCIAAAAGTMAEYGMFCIQQYKRKFPDCRIEVIETTHRDCDRMVESGEVDLGFAIEEVDTSKFNYYRMFSAPSAIVLRKDHPMASLPAVTFRALDNVPMVLLDESSKTAERFIHIMESEGANANVQLRVGEVLSIYRIIRSTMWVGLTNTSIANELNLKETVALPVECDRCNWNSGIIIRKKSETTSPAYRFFDYFRRNIPHKGVVAVTSDEMD